MEDYWSKENVLGIGAGISSSPKLVDNKIVFGAHDTFVYALNPASGSAAWKFKTNGAVYSTAAIQGGVIYIGSQDGFLYALSKDGSLQWKYYTGSRIVGSPVCGNNRVVFGTDEGDLFALDADGGFLWKFKTGAAVRTTPSLVGDKIIFGSHDHCLYCLNENGSKEWKFVTGGPMWTCPCIVGKGGKVLWNIHNQNVRDSEEFLVYFGSFDGGLYCLDESGKFVWKFLTHGANSSGPEFDDGILYFGSTDGNLYALDSRGSNLIWKFRTVGEIGHSSPLVHKENIFICDFIFNESSIGGNVYCVNKTGKAKWSFKTDNAVVSTPLIDKDILFVGSWDGYMYAISINKQEVLWKFRTLFDRLNFDISAAAKHMREQEIKAKEIFGIWKPEIVKTGALEEKQSYGLGSQDSNIVTYGGVEDSGRFSYSASGAYGGKQKSRDGRKDIYK